MAQVKLASHIVHTMDAVPEGVPDGVKMIGAPSVWGETTGGGIVVAVLDTGVDFTHPNLQHAIIGGHNFTDEGTPDDYHDGHYHGTHVTGTIVAKPAASVSFYGVAPDAKVLALKVLNSNGEGNFDWTVNAIDYAINWRGVNGERVRVISMSLGAPTPYLPMELAVKKAVAAGIVVCCAAGNDGDGNPDTVERSYPAYYHDTLCIGAFDMWGGVSTFSNSDDEIDVIAPGSGIVSTVPGGGFGKLSGTSMSTPHVSGSMALIIDRMERVFERTLTEAELYAQLVKLAQPLANISIALQGNGLVNLALLASGAVSPDAVNLTDALAVFVADGAFNSYDYWEQNAQVGMTVRGDYMALALKKLFIRYVMKRPVLDE